MLGFRNQTKLKSKSDTCVFIDFLQSNNTLENHCTRTVQSSRVGCSLRVHRIVYLAVKKGNVLVKFYF